MTPLVVPPVRFQASYLAASDEFNASGEQRDGVGDLGQPAEWGPRAQRGVGYPAVYEDSRNGTRPYWVTP